MNHQPNESIDQLPPGVRRPPPTRLSIVFQRMADDANGSVKVATIRDALGDRSFAALLIFFAALNLLPLPPPSSAILGLPLVIVAAQMVSGRVTVWLPRVVLEKSLTANQFRSIMSRLVPWLVWLERYIQPRYWPFWRRQGERVVGAIALLLAIVVTLPIPLGNWLPALSIFLLGFALSERDGVLLAVGSAVGLLALLVIGLVIGSAGALFGYVWSHADMFWPR